MKSIAGILAGWTCVFVAIGIVSLCYFGCKAFHWIHAAKILAVIATNPWTERKR